MLSTNNCSQVGAVAKAVIIAAGFVLAGCAEKYSRSDFETLVKDKSKMEVVAALGKPSERDPSKPGRVEWTYESRTFNIDNQNRFDRKTIVVFSPASSDGTLKVREVLFE